MNDFLRPAFEIEELRRLQPIRWARSPHQLGDAEAQARRPMAADSVGRRVCRLHPNRAGLPADGGQAYWELETGRFAYWQGHNRCEPRRRAVFAA